MGAEPVYPWAPWITSFTLMSNRSQEEEEHKSKDLHRLRNLPRFMPSPATPTFTTPAQWFPFFLFIFSPRVSFHFLPVFCLCTFLSRSLCTCTSSATPHRPAILLHLLLPRTRAHISKTAVCQLFRLQVIRCRSSICKELKDKIEVPQIALWFQKNVHLNLSSKSTIDCSIQENKRWIWTQCVNVLRFQMYCLNKC